MIRIVLFFLAVLAGTMFGTCRAAATTEFCPAVLDYAPVDGAASTRTYGVQLRALSDRQVSARIAFDTNAGWYQADIPQTALAPAVRTVPVRYPVDIGLSVSPVMFVRFPSAVHVNHAFVTSALSFGDIFHWSDRGKVTCPIAPEVWQDPRVSLQDAGALRTAPESDAAIIAARPRSPLEPSNCADAFSSTKAVKLATPEYPDAARAVGATGSVIVGVAVNPNGTVADAWVQGSANDATLDAAAQAAAQSTAYEGARAYCQAVPSIFYFVATFGARP